MRLFPSKLILASLAILTFSVSLIAQGELLQTPAERVDYLQGGTLYEPLMEFVSELDASSELMSVQKLTETLLGRDVVLCILSDPPVYQPEDVRKSGKPVVLIVNNVHGAEVAGKDASLEIMRDLLYGDLRPLLKQVVVLNVPTINPDGAEARRRENEQGFDLNRDYVKLESREIRSLVTRVINRWQPDIWVDTHHGGSAPYTLTYQTNMNPAGDVELMRFGNERILPRVQQALRAEDYDGFWYTGPGVVNGVEGWVPTSVEPRKQHVYGALANTVGFLFESPSGTHRIVDNGTRVTPVPRQDIYRHQVRGQYIGLRELIRFAADNSDALIGVVAAARQRATALGSNDTDNDPVPIAYRQTSKGAEDYWVRIGFGAGGAIYEKVHGPVFTRFEVTRSTTRPWGYLLPPSLADVVPLLQNHRITVHRLTAPATVEVETYYAREVQAGERFQGHYLRRVRADKRTERMTLPAGSFFVPSGQPRSNLISYLLEPETDDNILTWGFLDDFVRVTSPVDEPEQSLLAERRRAQPQRRAGAAAVSEQQSQRIPIYRLMKMTPLKTLIVTGDNGQAQQRGVRARP